MRGQEGG